ncbi:MAG: signal recognition particle-docking protein FtsY [Synechococcus sp. SB0678_bin_12]|nr:signal recognition particle-docking protein FtsY [Synechococcus sp. SB0678_bin_12]
MVFDWFRRRQVNKPPGEPQPPEVQSAAPPPADPAAEEPQPAVGAATDPMGMGETPRKTSGDGGASPAPELSPDQSPPVALPSAGPAAGATASIQQNAAPPSGAAPVAASQDTLAWAKAAYARLKAEQTAKAAAAQQAKAAESSTPVAETPSSPPSPLRHHGSTAPETVLEEEATPPEQLPPCPSAAGMGLLAKAAAEREQRQAELDAQAVGAEPPRQSDGMVAPEEPGLGSFDEEFTWSAEVLAAQGRQVKDVSLEEIHWLGRLRQGMEKTRRGLVTRLLNSLGDDPLTPEIVDDLEAVLLQADVGVEATDAVLDALRRRVNEEVVPPGEGLRLLKDQLRQQLERPIRATGCHLLAPQRERLNVWLLVGVNGVGKTTTLGKLANLAVRSGYRCMVAAADTFRAAAVEQVSIWAERSQVEVIANPSANADPAAVVFDAIGAAQAKAVELLLVDTAGRLQTKHNLMEELAKIRTIIDRKAPDAVVESLLVLDASQGQNGLRQALAFAQAAQLTGVVMTKLDGSAKGGVALAVASEANLPIRFIGAGEGLRDLRPFNGFEFVEALMASPR